MRFCRHLSVILIATVAVTAGCDSKKQEQREVGGGAFVRDGAEPGHAGFVEVSQAAKPSPETEVDESEPPSAETGSLRGIGMANVETVETDGDSAEARRRDRAQRNVGNQSIGEEPKTLDIFGEHDHVTGHSRGAEPPGQKPAKREAKQRSASSSDDSFEIFGRGADDRDDSKIRDANESVEQEVTFGPSRSEMRRKIRRKEQQRRQRERREEGRERRERQEKELSKELAPPASTTSTFSMDVDTGSYTLVGRKLARGFVPTAEEVRAEEFINFFEYDYPNPKGAFGLTVEGAPSPFRTEKNHFLVRFGVQARKLESEQKRTKHVTLLVDTSRSMDDADALPIVRESIASLLEALDDSDTVSLVVYDSQPRLLLDSVEVSETERIYDGVAELEAEGASGLQEGLEFAYSHANQNRSASTRSNVMVFSDGAANLGATRGRRLAREVSKTKAEDVGLTVLGVGDSDYNDDLLEQLADRGDGAYYHVNALPEAERLFGQKLDTLLYTVARDAKIQVEFDPDKVKSFRRIGYENRALPDEFFRRDDVDAAEVGPGQSVTALFEVELEPEAKGRLGRLSIRYNEPAGKKGRELGAEFFRKDLGARFEKASDDFRFAAAMAGFAEILERTDLGRALDIDRLIAVAEGATKRRDRREAAVYLMRRLLELAN